MKVWVVAKEGLVGKEFCTFFQKHKIHFMGTSHHEVDVTHVSRVMDFVEKERPTIIINGSAYTNVDLAEKEKECAYNVNVNGPLHLAMAAKSLHIPLLHISTDYVFDGKKIGDDYTEEDPTHAVNVYGQTKLEGEQKMLSLYPHALSVRTASLYGLSKDGLITSMVKALQSQEEVNHVQDQISSPTFTEDLVKAMWDVRREKGVLHFVNRGAFSRCDLLSYVHQFCLRYHIPIKAKKIAATTQSAIHRPAIRPVRTVLSVAKIEKLLSFPIRTVEEALQEYLLRKFIQ